MTKPEHIDPQRCNVKDFLPLDKDNHELYKDKVIMEYWWGILELTASFETQHFVSNTEEALSIEQRREIQYLQLLHYTVFVKLAGAYYQIEQMNKFLDPVIRENYSLEHISFMTKEYFDALHTDLYQSVTALSNQFFILLNRSHYEPTKVDTKHRISMAPSDLSYWLKINNHPDYGTIRSMLFKCERNLDIRHHATHYGFVPVTKKMDTGEIFIQRDFQIGDVLTKYDLPSYKKDPRKMITVIDASQKRTDDLRANVNDLYKYLYSSDIFDSYLNDRGLNLKAGYTPYWECNNLDSTI